MRLSFKGLGWKSVRRWGLPLVLAALSLSRSSGSAQSTNPNILIPPGLTANQQSTADAFNALPPNDPQYIAFFKSYNQL